MKNLRNYCLLLLAAMITTTASFAHGRSTIILIRHAEKASTSGDPILSKDGFKRAAALPEAFAPYKPDLFYSTDTKRTRQTLATWSKSTGKELSIYDAAKQDELAKELLLMQDRTIVVVGHSNTIPQLVNLLIGANTYTDMAENEFNKAYIITVEHGHATAVVKEY